MHPTTGQTGSGKTYTMGSAWSPDASSQQGVIPSVMEELFGRVDCCTSTDFTVKVSFVEIHKVRTGSWTHSQTLQALLLLLLLLSQRPVNQAAPRETAHARAAARRHAHARPPLMLAPCVCVPRRRRRCAARTTQEEVRDLLWAHPVAPRPLVTIRELPSGVSLAGATEVAVASREEMSAVLLQGTLMRAVASTNMNNRWGRAGRRGGAWRLPVGARRPP